jgi:hypothetical protein
MFHWGSIWLESSSGIVNVPVVMPNNGWFSTWSLNRWLQMTSRYIWTTIRVVWFQLKSWGASNCTRWKVNRVRLWPAKTTSTPTPGQADSPLKWASANIMSTSESNTQILLIKDLFGRRPLEHRDCGLIEALVKDLHRRVLQQSFTRSTTSWLASPLCWSNPFRLWIHSDPVISTTAKV